MRRFCKRVSVFISGVMAFSALTVPTFAKRGEGIQPIVMMSSIDQEDEWNKVDGKNIKGITSTDTINAQKLAEHLVSKEIKVISAKLVGNARAFGYFSNASKEVGFEEGIVLSTGEVNNIFEGGYDVFNTYPFFESTTPAGLEFGFTDDLFNDICILEFEIIPTTDTLSFQYVLASEEYPEFATSEEFFDEFILLVNGKNYARVPNTDKEVSIGTVNHVVNAQYYRGIFSMGEEDEALSTSIIGTPISEDSFVYNGATKVFSVDVKINPNVPNTIRLGIADKGDSIYDSSIFIKANSIKSKPATPGVVSIAHKSDYTIGLVREEGSDGYISTTWEAYGEAPVATFSMLNQVSATNLLGTGVVEFNDGQTTGSFTVPEGTDSIIIKDFQGGATGGAVTQAILKDIPVPGEVKAPTITGQYINNSIQLMVDTNGNPEGYEYLVQRCNNSEMIVDVVTKKEWSTTLSATDTDVKNGQTYYYRVKARNGKGFESSWSSAVEVKAVASNSGNTSDNTTSSNSSNSSGSQTDNKTLLKDKINKMTQDEKAKYKAGLLEYMCYTYEDSELKQLLKTAIMKSKLEQKDKEVFLANLDLFVELNFNEYKNIDLSKTNQPEMFKDLSTSHWAFDVVSELVKQGIVKGYEDGTFRPSDMLTVKDTFVFLDRVVKNNKVTEFKNPRNIVEKYIVDQESWSYYNVASIGSKISEETLAKLQKTDTVITRELLAQVIFELTGGNIQGEVTMDTFLDWEACTNKEAVQYCVELGLMKGYPDKTIAPNRALTRAELMSVLARLSILLK